MHRRFCCLTAVLLAAAVLCATPAPADDKPAPKSRSTSSAILGAEGWYAGALPPPGWHILDYTLYYNAHEMKGQDGGNVDAPPFTGFNTSVIAQVIRPMYVSDTKILGGNVLWHAVIPILDKRQSSDFFRGSEGGLGDIYLNPITLAWHKPPFHYAAGLDVIAPTGEYDEDQMVNVGNNHWTLEPAFAVSYLSKSGFCASTKLMYDYHTENHDIHYQEGQQFHLDYNVGYRFGKNGAWKAGIGGYWLTSLEDDTLNDDTLHGSEERVYAAGPTIQYAGGNWSVALKAQEEFQAKNRPEGTSYWLKLIYSF